MKINRRLATALGCWFLVLALSGERARAQVAMAAADTAAPKPLLTSAQLEELVGRVALYPDDLLAILLPASTFPLDIVEADRFLAKAKAKADTTLKPDSTWNSSVQSLCNYPDVVKMMSDSLRWTQQLGDAVLNQQADVLKAVQAFRSKVDAAGNLKSDDKQVVVKEQEVIKIIPAEPEKVYVPTYQPTTVVVEQAYPPVSYYPYPYPSYYYPYAPGAAFATGVFFGAATAWAFDWYDNDIDYDVDVDHHYDEIERDLGDRSENREQYSQARQDRQTQRQGDRSQRQSERTGAGERAGTQRQGTQGTAGGKSWGQSAAATQQRTARTQTSAATRPGAGSLDRSTLGGGQGLAGNRPSGGVSANRPSGGVSANRPSGGVSANRPSGGVSANRPSGGFSGGSEFGSMSSQRSTSSYSSRGSASRSSSFSGGGRAGGGRAGGGGRRR
jgi:hypothetical protein